MLQLCLTAKLQNCSDSVWLFNPAELNSVLCFLRQTLVSVTELSVSPVNTTTHLSCSLLPPAELHNHMSPVLTLRLKQHTDFYFSERPSDDSRRFCWSLTELQDYFWNWRWISDLIWRLNRNVGLSPAVSQDNSVRVELLEETNGQILWLDVCSVVLCDRWVTCWLFHVTYS